MHSINNKPKKRSPLRIKLGKIYFSLKRSLLWHLGKTKFSKSYNFTPLPNLIAEHKTPLYRELKDVDLWLQNNKVTNLKIALKKINGITIKPGETLSYWKLIGKPTKRKGYKKGMILFYGKFTSGTGGGLCQLSNLIHWMTLHTPLTITERHRHSYDIFPDSNRKQPFGSGATCVYNYRDLQIYNGTDETFQLLLKITEKELIGKWFSSDIKKYSYEVYEKEHKITHEHWGGYVRHNLIYKKIYDTDNTLIDDIFITENHALMMYDPFIEKQ